MDYSIRSYGYHIEDRVRTDAYIEALRRLITPETTVLDLGAGTGFFSLMACYLGAKHVYAVELNPIIRLLQEQAANNGWTERITIYQARSTEVELPERVDVIISDLRGGMLPLYRSHIQTLHDAAKRFLKPDGVLLPNNDTIYLSPTSDEQSYEKWVRMPWHNPDYPFDMAAVFARNIHIPFRHVPKVENIVLDPQRWASIDYGKRESAQVKGDLSWQIESPATIHFLCAWFESTLIEGIGYSTSPFVEEAQRPKSYNGLYLPLESPIALEPGERLNISLTATYIEAKDNYTFTWRTQVVDSHEDIRIAYRQSSFYLDSYPLSPLIKS